MVTSACFTDSLGYSYDVIPQDIKAVCGHQFVEVIYHTPSNCDVCNKTLPWSLNFMRRGECSYECQRETVMPVALRMNLSTCYLSFNAGCHLRSHKEHTEHNVKAMPPCVGGEHNIKKLLLLFKDRYL